MSQNNRNNKFEETDSQLDIYIPKLKGINHEEDFIKQWNNFARSLEDGLKSKKELTMQTNIPATFSLEEALNSSPLDNLVVPNYIKKVQDAFLEVNPDYYFYAGYYTDERNSNKLLIKIRKRSG